MSAEEPVAWRFSTPDPATTPPGGVEPSSADDAVQATLPQSLAGVFDATFELYRRHFLSLALIVAAVYLPIQILLQAAVSLWLRPLAQHANFNNDALPADPASIFLIVIGFLFTGAPQYGFPGLVSLGALAIVSGPVAVAVSELYAGRKITLGAAYRGARRVFLRLLGGWFLVAMSFLGLGFLTLLLISVVISALTVAIAGQLPQIVATLFLIIVVSLPYLVGCAVTALYFLFLTPLATLEDLPLSAIPARNRQLVGQRRFLRSWGAATFLPVVTFGLQMLMAISVNAVLDVFSLPTVVHFLLATAFSCVIAFFFQPYWMIFLPLLYFDYRVRREGYDIRLLAADFEARLEREGSANLAATEERPLPTDAQPAPLNAPPAPSEGLPSSPSDRLSSSPANETDWSREAS